MKKATTRELWAKQSLLLRWERPELTDLEFIQLAGIELMRRTDTSPERRARAATEQAERRENAHVTRQ